MSASTRVTKTVAFPDTPAAVLDYVLSRTAATIGHRVDDARLVVAGHVTQVEPVQAGGRRIDLAHVAVERALAGPPVGTELRLAHPRAAATGPPPHAPTLWRCLRGVFFLEPLAAEDPVAQAIAHPAFRLRAGDHDIVGRDDAALLDQAADAVAWYAALPADDVARYEAMVQALGSPNAHVARTAARALGASGRPEAAAVLEATLGRADDAVRDCILAALWRLGRRERAIELLEGVRAGEGSDAWLSRWGLAHSVDTEGRQEAMLFGPDPEELKGD